MINQTADFFLNGRPFMLARDEKSRGRAWQRTGRSDAPGRRSTTDVKYGELPDEIDHPEVWDDWSGGYGDAYRDPEQPNRVHWSEGMDTRFPRQMVHCQQIGLAPGASHNVRVEFVSDVPIGDPPRKAIMAHGLGHVSFYIPTPTAAPSHYYVTGVVDVTPNYEWYVGRPATFQANVTYVGQVNIAADATPPGAFVLDPQSGGVGGIGGTSQGSLPSQGFCIAGNRMWRYFGLTPASFSSPDRRYLQSLAALPDDLANWSATLAIGQPGQIIRDMIAHDEQVFCGMPDGLYAGDQSGTFFNVLGNLAWQENEDNCRDLTIHDGQVIAPHVAGITAYLASSETPRSREIGPAKGSSRSPVCGQVRVVRSSGPWLYAGLWTGSQSYILAGREDKGGYAWHVMNRLPHIAKVHRLHFDGVTVSSGGINRVPNRLWIATDASMVTGGTAPLYVQEIPVDNGNPLAPSPFFSANYVGSARVDLGAVDWQAPSTPKVFRSVEVWADSLLSGYRYTDVYYEVDGGSRTLLGRANDSPKSTIYFATAPFLTGQSIALSLESFSHSPALTPIYRAVVLRGALRPKSVDTITAVVRTADGVRDRRGKAMRPGAAMLADLRAYAQLSTPVSLIDLSGAASQVAVLAPIEEREVYQQGQENPEVAATVKMAVLSFS